MIIESVAAAGMLLQQINTVIQNVNEGKANVQQAMALVSDFGEALNAFEVERKTSTFSPLSKNDILKLQMLRRSQERYQKDLRDLLLVADPKLLQDCDAAIMQQERDRKAHQAMLNKKRKEREKLNQQLLVSSVFSYWRWCSHRYDLLNRQGIWAVTMNAKRLEEGSEYAEYDADGDGVVTDAELQTSKELQELRLQHERADAQRAMSWFALWGMLLYPSLVVASELFGLTQAATILGDMAAVYFVSVAGILAAFFGAQAWSNRK